MWQLVVEVWRNAGQLWSDTWFRQQFIAGFLVFLCRQAQVTLKEHVSKAVRLRCHNLILAHQIDDWQQQTIEFAQDASSVGNDAFQPLPWR